MSIGCPFLYHTIVVLSRRYVYLLSFSFANTTDNRHIGFFFASCYCWELESQTFHSCCFSFSSVLTAEKILKYVFCLRHVFVILNYKQNEKISAHKYAFSVWKRKCSESNQINYRVLSFVSISCYLWSRIYFSLFLSFFFCERLFFVIWCWSWMLQNICWKPAFYVRVFVSVCVLFLFLCMLPLLARFFSFYTVLVRNFFDSYIVFAV